jgi:hypothetical protein
LLYHGVVKRAQVSEAAARSFSCYHELHPIINTTVSKSCSIGGVGSAKETGLHPCR